VKNLLPLGLGPAREVWMLVAKDATKPA
jgi:hypothetical protein